MQIPWEEYFKINRQWVSTQNERYRRSIQKAAVACVFSEFMTDTEADWDTRRYLSREGIPREISAEDIVLQSLEQLKSIPLIGRLAIVLLALEKSFLEMSIYTDQESQKMSKILDREIRLVLQLISALRQEETARQVH